MQQGDSYTREIIEAVKKNCLERNKREKESANGYILHDGILYRSVKRKDLFVVPKVMRNGLTIVAHDLAGHFAVDRTIEKLQKDFWFSNMKRYVKHHINMCIDCLVNKKKGGKKTGYLHLIPPGTRSFSTIHMDHVGPFENTTRQNKYVLVIIDNLTKYVQLFPSKSTDTKGVLKSLSEFIQTRGAPDRIITDGKLVLHQKVLKSTVKLNL